MTRSNLGILIPGLALFVSLGCTTGGEHSTAKQLEKHVQFLASDDLLGRFPASRESQRASEYLASQLQAYGVSPAGEEGRYFQDVPMLAVINRDVPQLLIDGRDLGAFQQVFTVQFESDRKDRGSLDVRYVRQFRDLLEPPSPRSALVFHNSLRTSVQRWLEAIHGKTDWTGWGLIVELLHDEEEGQAVEHIPFTGFSDWELPPSPDTPDFVRVFGSRTTHAISGTRHVKRAKTLELKTRSSRRVHYDRNVVGILRGECEKDKVLVLSAHFDHKGRYDDAWGPVGPDGIFNGANDNASGVAVLLEVARLLAEGPPLDRTVVFLFSAAEEHEMLGSRYWVSNLEDHELASIVCNVNFDMLGVPSEPPYGAGTLWLSGFSTSYLGDMLKDHDLPVLPDPVGSEDYHWRSDNVSFLEVGLIGHSLTSFREGHAAQHYHLPSDELGIIDFEHMEACARLACDIASFLASAEAVEPNSWGSSGRQLFLHSPE